MRYYPEAYSHVRDKVKLVFDLSNCATKTKTEEDDLDAVKLKTFPWDLKKVTYVVDNEVVKNTKLNTLKANVNSLEKKIPDATALIHIDQYNTDKQI